MVSIFQIQNFMSLTKEYFVSFSFVYFYKVTIRGKQQITECYPIFNK